MSEWFFIRQKEGKFIQSLRDSKKITVEWKPDNISCDLPSEVHLPEEIFDGVFTARDLNYNFSNYLASKFGHDVSSWQVVWEKEKANEQ
mgnify:FL=1